MDNDNTFDIIHAHLSLHYASEADTKEYFKEIRRVLKDKGLLIFKVTSTDDKRDSSNWEVIEKDYYRKPLDKKVFRLFSQELIDVVLSSNNFHVIKLERIDVEGNDRCATDRVARGQAQVERGFTRAIKD